MRWKKRRRNSHFREKALRISKSTRPETTHRVREQRDFVTVKGGMLSFLFWNLNRKPLHRLVAHLVGEVNADVVILVEAVEVSELLAALNGQGSLRFIPAPGRTDQITILTRFSHPLVQQVTDKDGIRICRITLPARGDLLLATAHLLSALHTEAQDRDHECVRLATAIREAEARVGHSQTVLVGDLNVNPFQSGVVGTHGLHAVMSRSVASAVSRTVRGDKHLFFYNPMWSHFGDHPDGPSGTYFHSGSHASQFWHILDQVMVRPSLLSRFDSASLRIHHRLGHESLLSKRGRPRTRYSDHLPITFQLNV